MPLKPYLDHLIKKLYSQKNIDSNTKFILFNEYTTENNMELLKKSDIVIIWLNYEILETDIDINDFCHMFINSINTLHKTTLWISFEDYYKYDSIIFGNTISEISKSDYINTVVLNEYHNIHLIDLKYIISKVGIDKSYDFKNRYRWGMPYSNELISEIANEILKQYLILFGISKKCIILDCDNVLWGGILSEDGIENINLGECSSGKRFKDFQKFILNLYYHGVIIAICSKNDLIDVKNVFNYHSDMLLKEEYISIFEVNWNVKSENIKKISNLLNIGLDSIVFIDDSLLEIEYVKAMLPEITTIHFNINNLRDTYQKFSCFNLSKDNVYEDIKQRTETYRTNGERKNMEALYSNYNEYLVALEMKIEINLASKYEYQRLSELSQRTNKCTNGRRYTSGEFKNKIQDGYILYSIKVLDKYSDLGIVGAIGIDNNQVDLFCLSCRALNRNIEYDMLEFLYKNHNINNIYFKDTGKNHDLINIFKLKEYAN